jgi:putative membrane protein
MVTWSLGSWVWDPGVIAALLALVAAYVVGLRRFRPQTVWDEHVVSRRELICFAGAILLLVIALISPLDSLSNLMFVAHMFQHMLLIYFVPPLLLLGLPAWLIRPVLQIPYSQRVLRVLTGFVPATIIFNGVLLIWHMPALFNFTLVDPTVHAEEHLSFLLAGILLWWPVFSPLPELPRFSYPLQMLYMFVQSLVPAIIGAVLAFSSTVIYPVYFETPKLFGLTPLVDQQVAGLEMKLVGTVFLWVLVTIRFFQWFNHEEHMDEKQFDDELTANLR